MQNEKRFTFFFATYSVWVRRAELFSLWEAKLLIAYGLIQQFHEPDEAN